MGGGFHIYFFEFLMITIVSKVSLLFLSLVA